MKVLMPWADGMEEMEAVIVTDVLRRAGWQVVTAGLRDRPVVASRGVRLLPDAVWAAVCGDDFDMLVIPGGAEGVRRLCADASVLETVRLFQRRDGWIAAICAGPMLLEAAGVLAGRRVTAHPAVAGGWVSVRGTQTPVVRDGRLLTSQGPGTALLFALTLVACIEPGRVAAMADAMACGPEIKSALSAIMALW